MALNEEPDYVYPVVAEALVGAGPGRFYLQFARPNGTERFIHVDGLQDGAEALRIGMAIESVIGCKYVMHVNYGPK
jgi:hypothetical protein